MCYVSSLWTHLSYLLFYVNSFCGSTVQASVPSNTYAISGSAENKRLEELLPGILTQLGEESMDYLRSFAERSGALGAMGGAGAAATMPDEDDEDDDQVPELVENFEEAAAK